MIKYIIIIIIITIIVIIIIIIIIFLDVVNTFVIGFFFFYPNNGYPKITLKINLKIYQQFIFFSFCIKGVSSSLLKLKECPASVLPIERFIPKMYLLFHMYDTDCSEWLELLFTIVTVHGKCGQSTHSYFNVTEN